MITTALTKPKPLRYNGELVPSEVIHELANSKNLKEYVKDVSHSEKERIIAFMRTFNATDVVAQMFGLSRRQIERACEHNQDIKKAAQHSRNMAIIGLAEDRAIETLRGLDVTKVPDERKGRLVKDLVDSATLASDRVKPKEEKKEDSTMELIFRIKNRGQQPLQKPSESDDAIDAEFTEQP